MVIWLPITLFLWYAFSPAFTWPLALLGEWVMTGLFSDHIAAIELQGDQLDVVTKLPVPAAYTAQVPTGLAGNLVFSIDPLIYSYSLPLYTALIIATSDEESAQWRRWLFGLPILLLGQCWGVCFDILKTLLFQLGPDAAQAMAFAPWQLEIVALGYQLGTLILPSVLPVVAWLLFHWDYLAELAGANTLVSE